MVNPLKIADRILATLACALIKGYQYALAPLTRFFALAPSSCRYTPTCSHYALEAFRRHSFAFALALTLRRIARCHPFAKGGYDPVPQQQKKQKATTDERA